MTAHANAPVSRRRFMRLAGGAGIILGASTLGAGAWVMTRDPRAARQPWLDAGQGADVRVRALSYAVLAPNPHNRQPWLVDLSVPGEVTLFCDLDRRLPETDPFDRQITIGLGCFLELFTIAAGEEGYGVTLALFPEGVPARRLDARPVAHIALDAGGKAPDRLFAQIVHRRTNKEPYDTARSVPMADVEAILAAGREVGPGATALAATDAEMVGALRDLCWSGHEVESFTPRTLQESVDLMRIGKREVIENPDGIDLSGAFLEGLNVFGMLDRAQLADPQSQAFQQGMDLYRAIHATAMGYVWVVTQDNTRADQIAAGRAWMRIHLEATARGVDTHPLSQTLQEYPEMADLHTEAKALLGANAQQTVQMLARIGYGPLVNASPRWPVESRVRNA